MMFTGIITHLGKINSRSDNKLTINTDYDLIKKLDIGSSVSVNGICLTVIKRSKRSFTVDFMPETEKKTNIKTISNNDLVNLELSATPTTFLSGHIVSGHIDGVGEIKRIKNEGNSKIFEIEVPKNLTKYIADKGSIAINGISLTVIGSHKNNFTVGIIPHTLDKTVLKNSKIGDLLNLEVDVLAKYLEKLIDSKT